MSKFIVFIILFSGLILGFQNTDAPDISISNYEDVWADTVKTTCTFTSQKIPSYIYENMLGKSIPMKYKDKVNIDNLSYLQISYYGFDGESHVGEMIVNSKLADDVLDIFKNLYDIKYPIEKIRLIDEYDADDELSMSDNNTSCFCYRVIAGTNSISNHALRNCY